MNGSAIQSLIQLTEMPLFHFGNCLALACGPVLLTYKYSGLAEYNAFWKCVQSAAFYLFVQFVKMLTIATCFPPVDESSAFVVKTEFLKNTVDILDLFGLHIVITRICGKTDLKYLVAAIGWASAELVVTKFLPLWVGARGIEFDWKYIQMSLDSNIALVHHLSVAMLIWLRTRNDLNKSYIPLINVLLLLCCYRSLILEVLVHAFGLGAWIHLLSKCLFTASVGLPTLQLYLSLPNNN